MVGTRAVEELLDRAPGQYDITVFGEEPHAPYNRILLSSVLAGEKSAAQVTLRDPGWFAAQGVRFLPGRRVVQLDREARRVIADDGTSAEYDRLLLATGSKPIVLPLPGVELPGAVTFRDLRDVQRMLAASQQHRRAVVIGGGLLGLEAAHGLMQRGMEVTVVHLMDSLMERQLDPTAARLLREALEERSFQFRMQARTEAIEGDDRVRGVRLADGERIAADLVVMAVGIRPNKQLAEDAGLSCGRGIIVDDTLTTSDEVVYAVGECCEHRGRCYGLVAPLYDMCKAWARHMVSDEGGFVGSTEATRLKVAGVDVFSGGDFLVGPGREHITMEDKGRRIYKKVVIEDDRVRGVLMVGNTSDAGWYAQLLKDGSDVSSFRDDLIFGRDFARADEPAVPLGDDAEICGCNGVCKSAIVQTIVDRGLTTLEQVRSHTKASASCGSCTPAVEQLMVETLGERFAPQAGDPPLCPCTEMSHDEVRAAIVRLELRRMSEVMRELSWDSADGCHKCRPALNFYLLAAWPDEYVDDAQSRFVNERLHANIQKDGSYSVVPRIWGGVTTPDELRAIADAADKYQVRTVKITGGQRLDLLGVNKDDLPAVWRDLNAAGLVSGHAYGKAVRTVKTCVGSEWCRVGVQDSTTMGQRLERLTWGAWAPHKFKMGVSGCPRNCAEATIKDFGVVAVDSGWELYVGGNGGMKVRACDLLCHVETQAEVLEYGGAFLQLYREEGRYGVERTAHYVERVGLDHIKRCIVADQDNRKVLYQRFLKSQQHAQRDPWAERAEGTAGARTYRRLRMVPSQPVASPSVDPTQKGHATWLGG